MKALGALLLLLILVGIVGMAAGWFTLSTESRAGETEVKIKIDRDEIASDTAAAREKLKVAARELADKIEDAEEPAAVVAGTVEAVETASFTLRSADGAAVSFLFDADMEIEIDGIAAERMELLVGDIVVVTDADGDSRVDRIIVAR